MRCYYGFSQGWKSFHNTVVHVIKILFLLFSLEWGRYTFTASGYILSVIEKCQCLQYTMENTYFPIESEFVMTTLKNAGSIGRGEGTYSREGAHSTYMYINK